MSTNGDSDIYSDAYAVAMRLLPIGRPATNEEIEVAVSGAAAALAVSRPGLEFDQERLRREVETEVAVWVEFGSGLSDDEGDHVDWLPRQRAEIEWRFWRRYETWLRGHARMPPRAVDRLDQITDDILALLEDPSREGPWDRRGMIVGQVQSGKTANYTGLICKAADAGYKLIVVLAGIHNSLRSQTQLRLDEGFLGFDTRQERFYDQRNLRMGVGLMPEFARRRLHVHSLTTSMENGDFNTQVARRVRGLLGSDPVLLVVKKNATVLRNVIRWATSLDRVQHPTQERMVVPNLPLLVIDDEADYASVNTREVEFERDEDGRIVDETDPTRINALIRELLFTFEQSGLVSYTATPFANIFMDDGEASPTYGEDLFPRSFIRTIPPPTNYIGPTRVFGLSSPDPEAHDPGLPIVREVDDSEDWLAPKHKKDADVGALPDSLRQALRAFVLTCAARAARGQEDQHNSMLVHVTHYVRVQGLVADQIENELRFIRDRLRYGDDAAPASIRGELEDLWRNDYEPTSTQVRELIDDHMLTPLSWHDVEPHLAAAAGRVEVLRLNGSSADALAYIEHPDGFNVIAIGGNKLSRGLTLEGLSISYYLRATRMYDTLMQMGRWFGYRPGYSDLCRLYTTRELTLWYRDITAANEELLGELREMATVGATPRDFGLRVREHPDGLLVTARTKMRNGREMRLTFSGTVSETTLFDRAREEQVRNIRRLERFIEDQRGAGRAEDRTRRAYMWRQVAGADVADLLEELRTHPDAHRVNGRLMARYIRSRIARHELTSWTVALLTRRDPPRTLAIAGLDVGLIQRAPSAGATPRPDTYVIKRVLSPSDEALDLDERERARALQLTREEWRQRSGGEGRQPSDPEGVFVRRIRSPERGLLLLYPLDPVIAGMDFDDVPVLGFGVSFPRSGDEQTAVSYRVNNVYWQLELAVE
jgi:hypothetical protein